MRIEKRKPTIDGLVEVTFEREMIQTGQALLEDANPAKQWPLRDCAPTRSGRRSIYHNSESDGRGQKDRAFIKLLAENRKDRKPYNDNLHEDPTKLVLRIYIPGCVVCLVVCNKTFKIMEITEKKLESNHFSRTNSPGTWGQEEGQQTNKRKVNIIRFMHTRLSRMI